MRDNRLSKGFCFILLMLFLTSLFLKVIFSDNLSLWLDEAYTVWFTKRTWFELWFWVPEFESHPPLYYSLMKMWGSAFGELNGIYYRYASIFLSCCLFVVSFFSIKSLKNYLGLESNNSYLASSLLILFSPIIFWYSVEARPYLFFSLSYFVAVYYAMKIIMYPGKNRYWFFFVIGSFFTNWSHSIGPLFSAALFLALFLNVIFLESKKKYLINIMVSGVVVGILSIPLVYFIFNQLSQWSVSTWIPEPSFSSFWNAIESFLFPNYFYGYLENRFGIFFSEVSSALVILIISALLSFGLFKVYKKNKSLLLLYVLSVSVVPVVTLFVSYYGPNVFLTRTLVPVLAPYFVLLSISIGFISNKRISFVILLAISLNLSAGIYGKIKWGYKEPWQEITDTLINQNEEGDAILLLPNSLQIPIGIYDSENVLSGIIASLPEEYPAIGVSSFYPAGTPSVPGLTEDDIFIIKRLTEGKSRVLLLTRSEDLFDPDKIAKKFLSTRYVLVGEKRWGGIILYIFESP